MVEIKDIFLQRGSTPRVYRNTLVFIAAESRQLANLKDAVFHGAVLEFCDLQKANLYGADFSGADLHRANLRQANIRETVFEGANMKGALLDEKGR